MYFFVFAVFQILTSIDSCIYWVQYYATHINWFAVSFSSVVCASCCIVTWNKNINLLATQSPEFESPRCPFFFLLVFVFTTMLAMTTALNHLQPRQHLQQLWLSTQLWPFQRSRQSWQPLCKRGTHACFWWTQLDNALRSTTVDSLHNSLKLAQQSKSGTQS